MPINMHVFAHIAEKLSEDGIKVSADEVKKKISNIRSQFNLELTKLKEITHSGAGTDDMYEPSAWWFTKVKFLKQFIKTRKSKSNFKPSQNLMERNLERNQ